MIAGPDVLRQCFCHWCVFTVSLQPVKEGAQRSWLDANAMAPAASFF
jgi:hypothetical protein